MRNTFFDLLHGRMREDDRVFLLYADMGLGLVDRFKKDFPSRCLNVGIAEQNMIGVASGLCNAGFKPFCYTISNFLIERCFEQIRNDVCLHGYPITLVGTSTGFDNGLLGATHQVVDDIGCLKALPAMAIYSPGASAFMPAILDDIVKAKTPAYVRIGKGNVQVAADPGAVNALVHDVPGADTLLIAHGSTLANCLDATALYGNCAVYCINKIKPLEKAELAALFARFRRVVVVEDHFVTSGLYDSLCRQVIELDAREVRLTGLGPREQYERFVGDAGYFADYYGYSPQKIADHLAAKR